MGYRVSYFFTQQGDRIGGWSENFWNNASDLPTCLTRAQALRTALTTAKGDQTYCPRFRISEIGKFRNATTFIVSGAGPRTGGSGSLTPTTFASDYIVTKILWRFASAPYTSTQWFGGQIDAAIVNGGYLNLASVTGGSYAALFTALTSSANGWCMNTLIKPQVFNPLVAIDPTTGIVTLPVGATVPSGRIRIKGVRGLTYANRIWTVVNLPNPTTPPSFALRGWVAQTTPMTVSNNPTWAAQTYVLTQIAAIAFVRSSNHRAGRPTGQLGGRQKRRVTA